MDARSKVWTLGDQATGQQVGPVSLQDIAALLEQQRVSPAHLIFTHGMREWMTLHEFLVTAKAAREEMDHSTPDRAPGGHASPSRQVGGSASSRLSFKGVPIEDIVAPVKDLRLEDRPLVDAIFDAFQRALKRWLAKPDEVQEGSPCSPRVSTRPAHG